MTCIIVFVLTVSVVKRMTHSVRIKESFLYLNSGKFDNFHAGKILVLLATCSNWLCDFKIIQRISSFSLLLFFDRIFYHHAIYSTNKY